MSNLSMISDQSITGKQKYIFVHQNYGSKLSPPTDVILLVQTRHCGTGHCGTGHCPAGYTDCYKEHISRFVSGDFF